MPIEINYNTKIAWFWAKEQDNANKYIKIEHPTLCDVYVRCVDQGTDGGASGATIFPTFFRLYF